MSVASTIKWILDSIPRAPKRAGVLMKIYYCWQECFTPAGHAAAALFALSLAMGMIPGFWAAWIFCGLDFLFFLALIPTWYLTTKNKAKTNQIRVNPVVEGKNAVAEISFSAITNIDQVSVGAFRMDPQLKCLESKPLLGSKAGNSYQLQCRITTRNRGAFKIPKMALLVPEINGMLRFAMDMGSAELLVYPRIIKVSSFSFLTSGTSGLVFAPLLLPSLTRGMDFVGVREYREGDSLRDLHHKAFARYGKPFTKEFETERGAGAVLVLDVETRAIADRMRLEPLIRLTAGVGRFLQERGALGRFFIGDEEIPIVSADGGKSLLEALARIPQKGLPAAKPHSWSPAARPMGPVLRLGLFPKKEDLVHKQIVVESSERTSAADDTLFVNVNKLNAVEVSL